MENIIKVLRRGQIIIPKNMREELGIEEGQKYGLRSLEGGVLILTPHYDKSTAALKQLRSTLESNGSSLDKMLTELRQKRETDGE